MDAIIINTCAHPINVWSAFPQAGGTIVRTFPACGPGEEVRSRHVDGTTRALGLIGGDIPIFFGGERRAEGLPAEKVGVYYIVSSLVAAHVGNTRSDLLVPGCAVKKRGEYVGCLGLCRYYDT